MAIMMSSTNQDLLHQHAYLFLPLYNRLWNVWSMYMFDCDKLNPSDQHDFSRLKYHISVQKYINMLASL
jgi:hypothetical protein